MTDKILRAKLIRLAHANPKLRAEILPLLSKRATEFSSPEALKDYLKAHPDADKTKHTVQKQEEGSGKSEDDGGEGIKAKLTSFLGKVKGAKANIVEAIKKAPEQVQKFVADPAARKVVLSKIGDHLKDSPKTIAKKVLESAKAELGDIKHATKASAKLFKKPPGPFSKEDKAAFYSASSYLVGAALSAMPPVGSAMMAAGAIGSSFAKHVAIKAVHEVLDKGFLHYEWAETAAHILHHVASVTAAEDEGTDEDAQMQAFSEAMLRVIGDKLKGISDEDMQKILQGAEIPDDEDDKEASVRPRRARKETVMSDFWGSLGNLGAERTAASLDQFLSGAVDTTLKPKKLADQSSLRGLTDYERAKLAVQLPVQTGTRVAFAANLEAAMTYSTLPADKTAGVVVTVRTASGDTNTHEGRVFVAFQDGTFGSYYPQHLRYASNVRTAKSVVRYASGLGDLSDFMQREASDDLIHKATKDLWSFKKSGDQYVLERLFNDEGAPLKV